VNDPDRRRSPDGFDDDAIFADIVAHLNDDTTEVEQPATPAADDAATDVETAPESTEESGDQLSAERPQADRGHWSINPPPGQWARGEPQAEPEAEPQTDPQAVPAPQAWRAHEVNDEYEEHFEPPPTTPLPAGDLAFWAIIAGMCGGPLLLLYLVFFNRNAGSYWILTAIAMSVGGFALLVSRMPGNHEDDDDGARF